jgi:hypothetical protein
MMVSDTAHAAAAYYRERWTVLRDEALQLADEAKVAGPLAARRLRNQSRLCDDYAVILHHAAWREEHPDEPDR